MTTTAATTTSLTSSLFSPEKKPTYQSSSQTNSAYSSTRSGTNSPIEHLPMSENCLSRTSSRVSEQQNVTIMENNRVLVGGFVAENILGIF